MPIIFGYFILIVDILKIHTRDKPLDELVDLQQLAIGCAGMTGAKLERLVNAAAMRAIMDKRDTITQDDLEEARQNMVIGDVNDDIELSEVENYNTAAHEAGHAMITVLREEITKRPVYVSTIQPRGGTLGHVLPAPSKDLHTMTIDQIIAQIDICLGGRVGEELLANFEPNKVTTGCSSDMKNATYYAEALIKTCGYSKRLGRI
eukprot:sb/3470486/